MEVRLGRIKPQSFSVNHKLNRHAVLRHFPDKRDDQSARMETTVDMATSIPHDTGCPVPAATDTGLANGLPSASTPCVLKQVMA